MREEDESLGVSDTLSAQGTDTPISKYAEDGFETQTPVHGNIDSENHQPPLPGNEVQSGTDIVYDNIEALDFGTDVPDDMHLHSASAKPTHPNAASEDPEDPDADLKHELDKLYLSTGRAKKDRTQHVNESKSNIGAAKAKRLKRAEKQAALEADGKTPPKPRKNPRPYDPGAAIQKARGETVTTGKKVSTKK